MDPSMASTCGGGDRLHAQLAERGGFVGALPYDEWERFFSMANGELTETALRLGAQQAFAEIGSLKAAAIIR